MSERYGYAEDGHTAWCVVDYERDGAVVSRHHMEQDAEAEAARLNAETPKRVQYERWAVINAAGEAVFFAEERNDAEMRRLIRAHPNTPKERIARVRIKEIEE